MQHSIVTVKWFCRVEQRAPLADPVLEALFQLTAKIGREQGAEMAPP